MSDLYPPLNLPPATLNIVSEPGKRPSVMCLCRKRRVALTPEEWVRQHFIAFLTRHLGYPQGLVAAEKSVDVHGLPQRADVVVFSREMKPLLIVECKAPSVTLCQATLNQALRYFSQLGAKAIVLTNGLSHYCVVFKSDGSPAFAPAVPTWAELTATPS